MTFEQVREVKSFPERFKRLESEVAIFSLFMAGVERVTQRQLNSLRDGLMTIEPMLGLDTSFGSTQMCIDRHCDVIDWDGDDIIVIGDVKARSEYVLWRIPGEFANTFHQQVRTVAEDDNAKV